MHLQVVTMSIQPKNLADVHIIVHMRCFKNAAFPARLIFTKNFFVYFDTEEDIIAQHVHYKHKC